MVIVGDDCALPPPRGIAGRRGLAGTILVHKVVSASSLDPPIVIFVIFFIFMLTDLICLFLTFLPVYKCLSFPLCHPEVSHSLNKIDCNTNVTIYVSLILASSVHVEYFNSCFKSALDYLKKIKLFSLLVF